MNLCHLARILLPLLLSLQLAAATDAFFTASEQSYIANAENLTTVAELADYFKVQCSVYVDNVYAIYERFFYGLLDELPRSVRSQQLKWMLAKMEEFLEVEELSRKMQLFDAFTEQFTNDFENLFEYDAAETLLSAEAFNNVYVECGVEAVLNYAKAQQMLAFVKHTGNGIRRFLIVHRSRLGKEKILHFKTVVDQFLEHESFADKRQSLKLFLQKCNEFLE